LLAWRTSRISCFISLLPSYVSSKERIAQVRHPLRFRHLPTFVAGEEGFMLAHVDTHADTK